MHMHTHILSLMHMHIQTHVDIIYIHFNLRTKILDKYLKGKKQVQIQYMVTSTQSM